MPIQSHRIFNDLRTISGYLSYIGRKGGVFFSPFVGKAVEALFGSIAEGDFKFARIEGGVDEGRLLIFQLVSVFYPKAGSAAGW